jgi:hypothetical protein
MVIFDARSDVEDGGPRYRSRAVSAAVVRAVAGHLYGATGCLLRRRRCRYRRPGRVDPDR